MTKEDIQDRLEQLPHRAIVAFVARYARRVQPLTLALPQHGRDAIDQAIASAEAYANGDAGFSAVAARAVATRVARVVETAAAAEAAEDVVRAARAAEAAAEAAARAVNWSGGAAAWVAKAVAEDVAIVGEVGGAVWDDDWDAARSDLDQLRALNLGLPNSPGEPIDPSEAGPLGPLWP